MLKSSASKPLLMHKVYFFLMLGGLVSMIFNGPSDFRDFVEDRSQVPNIFYLAFNLLYLYIISINNKIRHETFLTFKPIIWLFCLLLMGTLFSDDIVRSSVFLIFILLQILITMYLFQIISFSNFVECLTEACLAGLVLSAILIFLVPSYGRMTYIFPGAWQGMFGHKNVFGRFALFAFAVFLAYWTQHPKRIVGFLGCLLSAVFVLGSDSATAMIGFGALVFAWLLLALPSSRPLVALAGIMMGLLIYGQDTPLASSILEALGKSDTLSGRTTVWEQALVYIDKHPLSGYGLGAFWNSTDAISLRYTVGWTVPHAHNGILELGLQGGYPLMIGFSAILALTAIAAYRIYNASNLKYSTFPILFSVHSLVYGMMEANFLRPNAFVQLCLYSVIFYGSRHAVSTSQNKELVAPESASDIPHGNRQIDMAGSTLAPFARDMPIEVLKPDSLI